MGGLSQFVILQTAARGAATGVAGTDQLQGISSHVMFVARGKAGPFRAACEPALGADGRGAVRVVLHDEGAVDKPITAGSYVFATAD